MKCKCENCNCCCPVIKHVVLPAKWFWSVILKVLHIK